MSIPETMKGVVLTGEYAVEVRDEPTPKIKADTDVILQVHLAGLCGSDLHLYRGHEKIDDFKPFIMGHEAVGEVVAVGSAVKMFKVGDLAISPFSLSCGDCFYCKKGYTSRCVSQTLLGTPSTPGAQAEYVRIPMADGCMFHLPEGIPKALCLLLTDILPTGYSTAMNARRLADEDEAQFKQEDVVAGKVEKKGVCVVIGCGPVGLCAITSATTLFEKVFATDLAESRLATAAKHGAIALPKGELEKAVLEATDGRGADAVLELVGHEGALLTALDLIRPYGVVSVGGVHGRPVTISGDLLYNKNVRMQFGRCSVNNFFPYAVEVLRQNLDLFSSFVEKFIGWDEAGEYYKLFEQNKIGKTVFVAKK